MKILTVTDGRRGIENQALGLAEAVSRQWDGAEATPPALSSVTLRHSAAFTALPPSLQLAGKRDFGLPKDADVVIGCGRQAIAPLIALRRQGHPAFTVFIQDPRTDPSRFDLVVAPSHDGLSGPFVETMIGSPNRVTEDRIVRHTLAWAERLSRLPMPRAAFMIGGPSKDRQMGPAEIAAHIQAAQVCLDAGMSVMITTSRRTPDEALAAWEEFATGQPTVWLHSGEAGNSGEAPNPYFALLGGADTLFVTEESTNMLTEACSTGKTVFRLPMGGKPGKFAALYEALTERCHVRAFDGDLSAAPYDPLTETDRVAAALIARYKKERGRA